VTSPHLNDREIQTWTIERKYRKRSIREIECRQKIFQRQNSGKVVAAQDSATEPRGNKKYLWDEDAVSAAVVYVLYEQGEPLP
jgi:hypothetical protein